MMDGSRRSIVLHDFTYVISPVKHNLTRIKHSGDVHLQGDSGEERSGSRQLRNKMAPLAIKPGNEQTTDSFKK